MHTEKGHNTRKCRFLYNLKFGHNLSLSHTDYIQYTLYLQQLAYRLMVGGDIVIYRKCI